MSFSFDKKKTTGMKLRFVCCCIHSSYSCLQLVAQNRKTLQLHVVKAISLVWCARLWQRALFQLSGIKGLPSARQLKILYFVCVCERACFAYMCVHMDKHTLPGLWFSWKFQRELLTPGEALRWSIKSLWSLSSCLHAAATVIICQQQFAKLHGSLSNPVIYD